MTITLALLGYAAVVAVVGPRLLTGPWTYRSPRLGLVLTHAAGISVISSVTLAGITCAATPHLLRDCLTALTGSPVTPRPVTVAAGLTVPVLLLARLALVAERVIRRHRTDRRRHRELLQLLGRHDSVLDATVVTAGEPAAYCLPGSGRVVVTSAAARLLAPTEMQAMLAHERAHLTGRHHLIVTWATILAGSFPLVPLFRAVGTTTAELVELLADDTAVRRVSRDSLAGALGAIATAMQSGVVPGRVASAGLAITGGSVLTRVQRLLDPPPPLPMAGRVGGAGAAVSVLALPALLVGVPTALAACPFVLG